MSTAEIVATAGTDLAQEQQRVHKALARRKVLVYTLRIGILVVTLGAWELAARAGWIDPFFFSMPSQIVDQMWVWATEGVREADRNLIANAHILGASRRQVTFTVVLPSAMSWILASLHVSFGFALVGAVVGEFLGAKQGIGLLIATAQGAFNAAGVFASMIILALVALGAEYLIEGLENVLLKWRPPQFAETGY